MKLRPFELGLVVIFVGLMVAALAFLSVYKAKPDSDKVQIGTVTIWGVLPEAEIANILIALGQENAQYKKVTYFSIPANEFEGRLVNALADGTGPDLVLASHEQLVGMRKRIQPVSYESFPLRDISDTYVDGARIFALQDGFYAYPIALDPLVMYWNKDILAGDNYLTAPETWEQLVNEYLPTLIRRNPDRSITRGVVAMGEYDNVQNSLGILSTLLLQAGTLGVVDAPNGYQIKLNQSQSQDKTDPLQISADFYTRFSRPTNSLYSWNRSYDNDKIRFLGEDLAFYFGYGSEGRQIQRENPNLNFDIAPVPQGAESTVDRTYARFYGISALRSSKNLVGASMVMSTLASQENSQKIADAYGLVPAQKGSVANGSNDTYGRVAYKSAIVAYGWLNPNLDGTNSVFRTMLQDINENRSDTGRATTDAIGRLKLEYN